MILVNHSRKIYPYDCHTKIFFFFFLESFLENKVPQKKKKNKKIKK